jgi:hypothetical protein
MCKLGHVLVIALLASFLIVPPSAVADTPQPNKIKECNTQAGDKKGDERIAFLKTCMSAKPATEGESQQEKLTTCNIEASGKGLKGDERNTFMNTCLSGKSATEGAPQQDKMAKCTIEALNKRLKGDERHKFMSSCLSAH